jgi:hypothetical protein
MMMSGGAGTHTIMNPRKTIAIARPMIPVIKLVITISFSRRDPPALSP